MASHEEDMQPEDTGYKVTQPKQSLAEYQNMASRGKRKGSLGRGWTKLPESTHLSQTLASLSRVGFGAPKGYIKLPDQNPYHSTNMWPLPEKPLPTPPGADGRLYNAQQSTQLPYANSAVKRQMPDRVPTPIPLMGCPPELRHLRRDNPHSRNPSSGVSPRTPTKAGGEVNRPLAMVTPEPAVSRQNSPASVRTVWPRFDYNLPRPGPGVATISEEHVTFASRAIAQSYESRQDLYLRPETYMHTHKPDRKNSSSNINWLRFKTSKTNQPSADANDDSLQRYKESLGLGGGVDLSDPNDPRVCIILSLSMETAGRDAVTIDLSAPGSQETLKDKPFQIKEGSQFSMVAKFKVQHEILSGLRYIQVIKRKGIKVGKVNEMIGSYAPNTDKTPVHSKKFPEYDAPSGMIARGHYTCSSSFVDDDKKVHLEFEWSFDIVKEV